MTSARCRLPATGSGTSYRSVTPRLKNFSRQEWQDCSAFARNVAVLSEDTIANRVCARAWCSRFVLAHVLRMQSSGLPFSVEGCVLGCGARTQGQGCTADDMSSEVFSFAASRWKKPLSKRERLGSKPLSLHEVADRPSSPNSQQLLHTQTIFMYMQARPCGQE